MAGACCCLCRCLGLLSAKLLRLLQLRCSPTATSFFHSQKVVLKNTGLLSSAAHAQCSLSNQNDCSTAAPLLYGKRCPLPPHPSRTTGTPTTSSGRAGARHAPCCTRRPGSADPREGDDPSSPASALLPIPPPQHTSSRSASLRRRLEPRIARFEIKMLAKARKPSRSQVQMPADGSDDLI